MYRHNLFELDPWFVYVKIQVKSLYKMTPVFVLCTKWPDTLYIYNSSYQCQLPYLHQLFTYNSLLTPCYYKTCISYLSICNIENPPNVHLGNFPRHWKWPPLIEYLWGLQYLKGRNCNFVTILLVTVAYNPLRASRVSV